MRTRGIKYLAKPRDGRVTDDGSIEWDGEAYIVWDETFTRQLITTPFFKRAVVVFVKHMETIGYI